VLDLDSGSGMDSLLAANLRDRALRAARIGGSLRARRQRNTEVRRHIDLDQGGEAVSNKVVINLATGMEDPERVLIAFLVGQAATAQGKEVAMFLTKDAVHLALPGHATGVACDGCPPLDRVFEQYAEGGGQLLACPFCVNARRVDPDQFVAHARVAGASPLWEWIGDQPATVFSY
jgi:predicted peroxiredoxin